MENTENNIEFLSGQHFATVTYTNRKHINRIKKLYETRKEDFKYFVENTDGSICAKIPLRWVKINPGKKGTAVTRTPEQIAAGTKALADWRMANKK